MTRFERMCFSILPFLHINIFISFEPKFSMGSPLIKSSQIAYLKYRTFNLHRFLRFYFCVFSLVLISIEMYQTLKTEFYQISNTSKFIKNIPLCVIFNFLHGVWKFGQIWSFMFDTCILHVHTGLLF